MTIFRGAGATGAARAAALPPLPLLCGGKRGQKVPFRRAQKCPLKNDKIIKNLKTANS